MSINVLMLAILLYSNRICNGIFCCDFRYIIGSTKEVTRWRREKGASRVFRLKQTSRLPVQSLLFSVTFNKTQIINIIISDLKEHKDDHVAHTLVIKGPEPVPIELPGPAGDTDTEVLIFRHDLRTVQEEADTIIVQQVTVIGGCTVRISSHMIVGCLSPTVCYFTV